ncbi:MAG: hypothetical protein JXR83_00515 [Deltaproteobacteria bacterium]|nr:hypothetical protein [Deltaproteobacteria bacterium]
MFDKAAKAITGAIEDLRGELAKINSQIAQLEDARRALVGGSRSTAKAVRRALRKSGARKVIKAKRGRGGMSAAARKAQSLRMKKYWAARRKGKPGAAKKVVKAAGKAKRQLSPDARKALSARMKAKWAAYRAQKPSQ